MAILLRGFKQKKNPAIQGESQDLTNKPSE